MSKNTNIADLINYISIDGSGNLILSVGGQVATQTYVTTAISNLVNAAPSTLDTLKELATALGNDANFATTVTNSIATKLPLSGGTLTGALNGTSATFSGQINSSVSRINGRLFTTNDASYGDMLSTTGVLAMSYDAAGQTGYITSRNYTTSTNTPLVFTSSAATFSSDVTTNATYNITNGLKLWGNHITTEWYNGNDTIFVNYRGYNGGTTQFRNFHIYNGKNSPIAQFDGSTGAATFSSSVTASQGIFAAQNGNSSDYNYLIFNNTESGYGDWNFYKSGSNDLGIGYGTSAGSSYTNAITIKYGGNVGIGTSSPAARLHVEGLNNLHLSNASGNVNVDFSSFGVSTSYPQARIQLIDAGFYGADLLFYTKANGSPTNALAERMRITSGGEVLIGKTSLNWNLTGIQTENNAKNLGITHNGSENNLFLRKNDATGSMIRFWYNSTEVGSVSNTTTSTSYNTSSDYRLKQDLRTFNGLSLVSAIKTYDYEWKSDKTRAFGVLAHELAEVVPYAVYGEKDGEYMQGVDYSKIVPVLVKAIQELKLEIEELKAKLN